MTEKNNQGNGYKSLWGRMREIYDYECVKIAGVVGTGIHLYSTAINSEHLQGIYEDFANGQYIRGTLKSVVPFLLPYGVSFYTRKRAKREVRERISALESKIKQLEIQE